MIKRISAAAAAAAMVTLMAGAAQAQSALQDQIVQNGRLQTSDPQVDGVICHVSQARTGGVSGSLGMAEDPSHFSLSCRQTGPITIPAKLPKNEVVFSEDTSLLFKETRVVRLWDEPRQTLVYLAVSRKIIEGAPAHSLSTVPVMPWR